MHEAVEPALKAWSDFYVMVGSSAAALTGLMFVVITLVAGDRLRATDEGISTFSTPTVAHFCAVLAIAGIDTAPWPAPWQTSTALTVIGVAGVAYGIFIMIRASRVSVYRPDLDDWTWYVVLPFLAYVVLVASALRLTAAPVWAPFGVALATLGLIFIGIHNAWDVVTYLATQYDDLPGPNADAGAASSGRPDAE